MSQNSGSNQRQGEKQAKLCKGCRRDADRAGAAGEFDREGIGELQCAEKGRTGRHEGAQARCAEEDESVGKPEPQPYALTRNHSESASGRYMMRVIAMTSNVRHVRRISNPCCTMAIRADNPGNRLTMRDIMEPER